MGNNAAGILNKLESFYRNIQHFQPGVYFIQESKCRIRNKVKHDDYVMFEYIRKCSSGGGLLTAVHKSLNPVSVSEDSDDEVLVVQGDIGNNKVRFINGYGPQEGNEEANSAFFNRLDLEVKSAQLAGTLICMELDANSKLGPKLIPEDPKEQSKNGELLEKVIVENDLIVVNGTDLCKGVITRFRRTIHSTEESVIDFFIVCRRFFEMITSLLIDENRVHSLTKYASKTGVKNIKESDHNNLIMEINANWNTSVSHANERMEIYNYRKKDDFENFKVATEVNADLLNCFDDPDEDLNISANRWLSTLNEIIKKSFKRIRINNRKSPNEALENLFKQKESIKQQLAQFENLDDVEKCVETNRKLEKVIEEIAEICALENKKLVDEYLGKNDDPLVGYNQAKTWALKKRLAPKNTLDHPAAKKDSNGTLITDKLQLEKLYEKTYEERLSPNPTIEGLQDIQQLQEYLFDLRCELAKTDVSGEWSKDDLDEVLKTLKNNKARDAHGHTYELFKYGGNDLKLSLLKLCNEVKTRQIYPSILQPSNITSLYKNKGEKADLNNDRGIFNVVKVRSILDKLIYNENYEKLDENMSSSNIGGRKNRNIRDHLFVINAILQDASKDKKAAIDIQIYDIKKCFDKMWTKETSNDLFDAGITNDQFLLIANSNKTCQVSIKTPWGSLTNRKEYNDIEMQGTVLTPIKCAVQIDTLGKEALKDDGDNLYKYKGFVRIPPMALIDDILTVTPCGIDSILMNAAVQSKVNNKRLELGQEKCFKMHVGNDQINCPSLKVHSEKMHTTHSEKYLGDIVANDGRIEENLKLRNSKGIGIKNQIMGLLREISFGEFFFEMAMCFRNSQLINGTMYNMEALHGIKNKHIDTIEECDKFLMRELFECPQGTPLEAFYMETSAIPLRFILTGRRIMYYWTILQKPKSELVREVFEAQSMFKTEDSWATQVLNDIKNCDINLTEDEMKETSQYKMKKLVAEKLRNKTDEYLLKLKDKHVKTEHLYPNNKMQEYLTTDKLTKPEKILLFKLRSRMIEIKGNFPERHRSNLHCELCDDETEDETQSHLLKCNFLLNHPDLEQEIGTIQMSDIFNDLASQIKAVKVWKKILEVRKIKLKK